jgi:hypothetical protein
MARETTKRVIRNPTTVDSSLQLLTTKAAGQQIRRNMQTTPGTSVSRDIMDAGEQRGIPFTVLLLLALVLLLGLLLAQLNLPALTNGSEEGLHICEQILLGHTGVPIQQEEQLTFHQVHLG